MSATGEGRWTVLYDADCGLCKWLLAGFLRWDRAGRLRPVALQRDDAEALLADLPAEERIASWHLISPAGLRRSGGEAVAPLLRLLPGGRLPAAAAARFPRLTERAYRWVAEHRAGLSRFVPGGLKRRAGESVRRRERTLEAGDG
jgi:predicted DCC family thiol-disulfide oxidoreductase YuxK